MVEKTTILKALDQREFIELYLKESLLRHYINVKMGNFDKQSPTIVNDVVVNSQLEIDAQPLYMQVKLERKEYELPDISAYEIKLMKRLMRKEITLLNNQQ